MDEARVERRLAAILAGDIAGYSRLMGIDEEGTLRQLKAHRKELRTIAALQQFVRYWTRTDIEQPLLTNLDL